MDGKTVARWLLQKLLSGLAIYMLIFWIFPILRINWNTLNFYEFYAWITATIIVASAIPYVLLPPELRIKDRLKFWRRNRQSLAPP